MHIPADTEIVFVSSDNLELLDQVRDLFREYAALIAQYHGEGCLGDFQREVDGLPGDYGPTTGRILVVRHGGLLAGCAALRKIGEEVCEMKRVYVRPEFRGHGIGRRLALAILEEARKMGFSTLRLDTMAPMTEAQALYRSLGFASRGPYLQDHPKDALFFELPLK